MAAAAFDKIVVITRKTALEELEERLGTRAQARFYLEQEAARVGPESGVAPRFADYERDDAVYRRALEQLRAALGRGGGATRAQFVDRGFLPTFTFGERDLVVTLGPDGLVVNTAKYLDGQPLLTLNPDPARIDGVLLQFRVEQAPGALAHTLAGDVRLQQITMARAVLADGQTLHAVNDLFVGRSTHVSARYRLRAPGGHAEDHSSSGIIVSTGAGSTGWLRSVVAGAAGVVSALGGEPGTARDPDACRFPWDAPLLRFSVREPWASKTTGATIVHGVIEAGNLLEVVSQMPQNGVIFSDGVEEDFLPFNSGAVARIGLADKKVRLVVPG